LLSVEFLLRNAPKFARAERIVFGLKFVVGEVLVVHRSTFRASSTLLRIGIANKNSTNVPPSRWTWHLAPCDYFCALWFAPV